MIGSSASDSSTLKWLLPLLTAALLALGSPSRAEATILIQMSIEELTTSADVVVTVEVLDQWAAVDDDTGRLQTYTRVAITSVLANPEGSERVGDSLIVAQEGGQLDDWGIHVAGNAQLAVGEEALLFLLRGDGEYYVQGMEQGKYGISRGGGPEDVPLVYRESTVPVVVRGIMGTSRLVEQPTVEMNGRPLDELTQRILDAVEGRP
jgi:hypothetical protein